MPGFFLTLNDEEKYRVVTAGVNVFPFNIGNDSGVLFDTEADLQAGLAALGMREDRDQRQNTNLDDILRIGLVGQPRRPRPQRPGTPPAPDGTGGQTVVAGRLEVEAFNGHNQAAFLQIIQQLLLPATTKKIILHAPHGNIAEVPPIIDGCIHMHFWASPRHSNNPVPATLWGIEVRVRNLGFASSGLGTTIFDSGGWQAAEVVGDNIYLHWDCCEDGSAAELQIFKHLMEAVALAIEYPGKSAEEIAALKANSVMLQQRRRYIAACRQRMGEHVTGLQTTVAAKEVALVALQDQLTATIRDLDFSREQLAAIESGHASAMEHFGVEFDRLLAIEGVCDVEIDANCTTLQVFTDVLFCRDSSGHNHEIGEFILTIPLTGHGSIGWRNQTRVVDGHHAPHIRSSPCLGNMGEVIPQLIGKFQFADLVSLCIGFIQSVNENDAWGRTILNFPSVRHHDPVRPAQLHQRRTVVTAVPAATPAAVPPPAAATPAAMAGMSQAEIDQLLSNLTGAAATPATEPIPAMFDEEDA